MSLTESEIATPGFASWELAEEERQHGRPRPGRAADLQPPRELPLGLARDVFEQLLLEREQALRAAVEPLPGLGRLDAATGAVEQPLPEALLERADLQADRGLRHAELLGRLRETPPVDHGAERR